MTADDTSADAPAAPMLRVHGPATAEEVAAVLAVLAAGAHADGAAGDDLDGRGPASRWASHRVLLRGRLDPGPTAWRTAYRR